MHTVIAGACTGCELCVAPCPVDCISLTPTGAQPTRDEQRAAAARARQHFERHTERILRERKSRRDAGRDGSSAIDQQVLQRAIERARQRLAGRESKNK
jgi:electron transport complex protein RnfB